jgi:hypothetical protein
MQKNKAKSMGRRVEAASLVWMPRARDGPQALSNQTSKVSACARRLTCAMGASPHGRDVFRLGARSA